MSSAKSSALTLLMVGSILLFIWSVWQIFETVFIYNSYYYDNYSIISVGLEFVASLLLMIGFIQYRGEQSKPAQVGYGAASMPGPQIQSVPERFCPKCGRQIPADAQFCPFCGWQAEGQKRK